MENMFLYIFKFLICKLVTISALVDCIHTAEDIVKRLSRPVGPSQSYYRTLIGNHAKSIEWYHWLRFPELIDFKLAVLVYRCLHGLTPHYRYLSDYFQHVAFSNC